MKKEWGRQQTILPAPPVASRPRPATAPTAPAAALADGATPLAQGPVVWPQGVAGGSGSGPGRAGPRVAAPALPGAVLPLVERAAADEQSDRLAFITQCLQVRRSWRQQWLSGRAAPDCPPCLFCSRTGCSCTYNVMMYYVSGARSGGIICCRGHMTWARSTCVMTFMANAILTRTLCQNFES